MKETSKFLSLVLRHNPSAAEITLDGHGWARVDELIDGVNAAGRYKLDMAKLEEIVRTDNKQRYSFNDDKTLIRANQGHSISVDVELKMCEPPEYLFHGTAKRFVDSIMAEGLKPQSRLYVHLSKDLETAVTVGSRHGKPFVFKVKSGEMHRNGFEFFLSENGVWLTKYVPVDFLETVNELTT